VVQAAKVLTNQEQFGMAQRKVTISTVGPSPEAFEALGEAPTVLAWSVHASSDELRKDLVPTTKYSMAELRRGYLNALLKRPVKLRTTMLGIALIDGINDSVADAEHLADFVQGMVDEVPGMKPMINLIPFNDIGFAKYRKPTVEQVWAYQERLTARGFKCFIRTTRGDDESAACGQLATKKKITTAPTSIE
jgi:23S rRNA (adenine2503-C2)-methyltransferase